MLVAHWSSVEEDKLCLLLIGLHWKRRICACCSLVFSGRGEFVLVAHWSSLVFNDNFLYSLVYLQKLEALPIVLVSE